MSEFVPNKEHLQQVLIFCYNSKKSAAETHRLLVETYAESAPTVKSCREWFRRFGNGDFSVDRKSKIPVIGEETLRDERKRKKLGPPNRYQTEKAESRASTLLKVVAEAVTGKKASKRPAAKPLKPTTTKAEPAAKSPAKKAKPAAAKSKKVAPKKTTTSKK